MHSHFLSTVLSEKETRAALCSSETIPTGLGQDMIGLKEQTLRLSDFIHEVAIVSPEGVPLKVGEPGEIAIRRHSAR